MNLNFKEGFNETAIVKRSELVAKIGNVYYYKVDLQRKKGVKMVLRYPIEPELGKLKRITNMFFYGKTRVVRRKAVKK